MHARKLVMVQEILAEAPLVFAGTLAEACEVQRVCCSSSRNMRFMSQTHGIFYVLRSDRRSFHIRTSSQPQGQKELWQRQDN